MPENYARSKSGLSDIDFENVHEYRRYIWNIEAQIYNTKEQEAHLRTRARELEIKLKNAGLNPDDYQQDLTAGALVSPIETRKEKFLQDFRHIEHFMKENSSTAIKENLFINMKKHDYIEHGFFGRIYFCEPLNVVINDKVDYTERTRETFNSLEEILEIWTVD